MRVAEIVVSAHGRLGDHAEAVGIAQQCVAAYPLAERAHRTLLSALGAAADRSAAVLAFERCRSLLADELGVDPSDETVAVYLEAIGGSDPTGGAVVPPPAGSFVGRARELAELAEALERPGLVTLTGRGGVGKSRLAAEAARRATGYDGGSLWVPLGTVADDPLVDGTVALRLGIASPAEDQAAALVADLVPRGRTLLVLDGCDAVADGVATLVTGLLEQVPLLTVLVTGRRAIGLGTERIVTLDPLVVPTDPGSIGASAVGRLLADRVRERGGHLDLDAQHAPAVLALCRRCAGLPLALELVAARLARAPGRRPARPPGRRRRRRREDSLRQVAEGSLALLAEDEAAVFRRLAVLDGFSSLTMIREVVADDPVAPARVVRILGALGSQGLVNVRTGGPRLQYELEDDLRRVAATRLADAGELESAYRRLAAAVLGLLPEDPSTPPAGYGPGVTAVVDSVRSLLAAGVDGRADRDAVLEIAFRLHRYWSATSIGEGRFWLERLLADDRDGPWTPFARFALGYLSYWAGDSETAVVELEAALPRLVELDAGYALRAMAFRAGVLDDLDRSREAAEQMRMALDAAETAADADTPAGIRMRISVAINLGGILAERGDPRRWASWPRPSTGASGTPRRRSSPSSSPSPRGSAATSTPCPRRGPSSTGPGRWSSRTRSRGSTC